MMTVIFPLKGVYSFFSFAWSVIFYLIKFYCIMKLLFSNMVIAVGLDDGYSYAFNSKVAVVSGISGIIHYHFVMT